MNNLKNKIIAISGEPVSGKGTTVRNIVKVMEQQGYANENIHIISAGHEFRQWFNFIIKFLKNFENKDKIEELSKSDIAKEAFSIKENRDAFFEVIKRLKTEGVDFSRISIEQANNMPELAVIRDFVDKTIDGKIRQIGKKINSENRPNETWIIDSRLAFANIPDAFSIRLTCSPEVAGKRLFEDNTRGEEDNKYADLSEAIAEREKRRNGEIERYKRRYGIDLSDENNYDMIIDTSYSRPEDISSTIIKGLEAYVKDEHVAKKWASPKVFIPTQGERDTYGGGSYSIDEVQESILKDGYDMNFELETIEVDGIKYVVNGHHRNIAAVRSGMSLVPYIEVAKDDEQLPSSLSGFTARQIAKGVRKIFLYGHEGEFDDKKNNKMFSYMQIYPNIYEILNERGNDR